MSIHDSASERAPKARSRQPAKPGAEVGSTVPRRQLGRHLRELRQQTGMSIAEVAKLIERGATTLQRLEAGTADRIRLWDIEALCRVLGADETTTDALKGLAQQGNTESWWHEYGDLIPKDFDVYIGLESAASTLTSFQELVPGLFQTPGYAESLIRAVYPEEPSSEITRRVEMKMHRQRLITRKGRPAAVDVILDESVLRRMVGSPRIMAEQLRYLADLSTKPNITVRVLPYVAGVPLGDLTGPFTIVDFASDAKGKHEPSVVYVENFTGDMYLERPGSVSRYRTAHEAIGRVALSAQSSRDLLRRAAREYERER
ncbi:helix-turn-helix domain-containing protein [Nocardia sp. CA-107356]|uniref:helix-turn-helix domain-containing protein n=1 Tax=Nocardia sp. CA-107356 TaxID=3239972 RepID=UPI003D8A5BE3